MILNIGILQFSRQYGHLKVKFLELSTIEILINTAKKPLNNLNNEQ